MSDQDRVMAQLVVEAGFATKEDVLGFWQRCQEPNSPRLIPSMVQAGRLNQAQVEQLKSLWQARQQGGAPPQNAPAQSAPPQSAPPQSAPPQSAPPQSGGHALTNSTPSGSTPRPEPGVGDPSASNAGVPWETALEQDTQVARLLLQGGRVNQAQLRECRDLQLQHKMRLGDVLVRKGYVDAQTAQQALTHVTNGAEQPPTNTPSGPQPAAQQSAPPPGSAGFSPQDAIPTLLGLDEEGGSPPAQPQTPPPQAAPKPAAEGGAPANFAVSMEELNPFANGVPDDLMSAPTIPPGHSGAELMEGAPTIPPGYNAGGGGASMDELNAFPDAPLPQAAPHPEPAGAGAGWGSGPQGDPGADAPPAKGRAPKKATKRSRFDTPKKKSKLPLILGLLVVLAGGGAAVAHFVLGLF